MKNIIIGLTLLSSLGFSKPLPADRWEAAVIKQVLDKQTAEFIKKYGKDAYQEHLISFSWELKPLEYKALAIKFTFQKPDQASATTQSYFCHEHGSPDDIDCH